MKRVFISLLLVYFSYVIIYSVYAEEEKIKVLPKMNFEVAVSISVNDEQMEELISILVKRELRSLGDVTFVDDAEKSIFVISIRQINVMSNNTIKTGNAISWVLYRNEFVSRYYDETMNLLTELAFTEEILSEKTSGETKESYIHRKELLRKLVTFYLNKNIPSRKLILHNVATCGDDGVGQVIQHMIAGIDQGVFEPSRKFRRNEIKELEDKGFRVIEKDIEEEPPF